MELLTAILIALSLSFDSFAVSISFGMCKDHMKRKLKLRIAAILGFFQGLAPLAGWLMGNTFKKYIESFDHWIAFGLLVLIGGRMIWENIKKFSVKKPLDPARFHVLIVAAIATSIDALMVGLSFAIINTDIYTFVIITALITFIASLLGIRLGRKAQVKWGSEMEILGGIILIAIGVKVLLEHIALVD